MKGGKWGLGRRFPLLLTLSGFWGCSVYDDGLLDLGGGGTPGDSGGSGGSITPTGGAPSGGGGATGGASPTGGLGGQATTLELIDDLEDGNVLIKASHGRTGNWDIANDGTGTQTPSPFSISAGTGAPPSDKGAYTAGSGFSTWASLNVSMRSGGLAYDASAYSGLSFRAKVGSGSSSTIRVRVVTGDTDPRGGICKDPSDVPTPDPSEFCYDHFFAEIDLTESWATYEVFFTDFGQSDTGMSFPSIDLAHVYQLEFYFDQPDTIELWVDDLSFIEG